MANDWSGYCSLIEGKASTAMPAEGATRASIIAFWAFSKGELIGKA
jgi:hypothetical protein